MNVATARQTTGQIRSANAESVSRPSTDVVAALDVVSAREDDEAVVAATLEALAIVVVASVVAAAVALAIVVVASAEAAVVVLGIVEGFNTHL